VRSVRARDASNSAATADIGVPVDTLITAKLQTFDTLEREDIIGLIEPSDGRFWLAMKDVIFTFSYFSGLQGQRLVDLHAELHRRWWRTVSSRSRSASGGSISRLRSMSWRSGVEYDATVAEAWLPLLDAERRQNQGTRPVSTRRLKGRGKSGWRWTRRTRRRRTRSPRLTQTTLPRGQAHHGRRLVHPFRPALQVRRRRPGQAGRGRDPLRAAMMRLSRPRDDVNFVASRMREADLREFCAVNYADNRWGLSSC
jgi:hypothetical protein